jgi:hypothetical protein
MAISNDILSSTLRIVKDQEVDNLFKSTPLLEQIRAKGGVEEVDGGSTVDRPLILAEHSSITQLSTGYEPVSLAVADAMRNASYNFCSFVAPIVITKVEELANKGDRAIVKIAEARLKSVMGMLKREFEKQAIAGSSTVLSDMSTLNGGASTTGFFDNAAFGFQNTNTVGGIAKGSFLTSYQNQRTDAAPSLSIADLTDLYIQCQIFSPTSAPNLILSSPNMYKAYKQLLFAQEFYMKETVLDGGRLALAFNGALMYVDPFLPVTIAGPNTISAYFLNTDYLKLVVDKDANFELSDFESVSGYASRSAQIMTRAQLVVDHLACQCLLVNGEA